MRRREFIGLVAGAAGALTCADVFAAQKSPIARIGYLGADPPPIECCVTPECRSVATGRMPVPMRSVLARIRFACARLARRREFADRDTLKPTVTLRASRGWRLNSWRCGPMF